MIEWGLCPPSDASPAVLGVWPIALYLSGPFILAKFGDRVGLFSPREASPAVLSVCTVELYLPGPIILAQFGDRVGVCPPSVASPAVLGVCPVEAYLPGPSLWPSLVIEWVSARRVRRLRQFWACDWLRYFFRCPSLWPSLVFARERGVSGSFRACGRLVHMSQGPSVWPSLVIEWVYARRVWRLRLFLGIPWQGRSSGLSPALVRRFFGIPVIFLSCLVSPFAAR